MRKIIFTMIVIFSTTAISVQAEQSAWEEICTSRSNYVKSVAKARDDGRPIKSSLHIARQGGAQAKDMIGIVHTVHEKDHLTPSQLQQQAYEDCVNL